MVDAPTHQPHTARLPPPPHTHTHIQPTQHTTRRRRVCSRCRERLDDALRDAEAWAAAEPGGAAAAACDRLRAACKARDEKLKDEMLGKLKDLGNSILGKFGMSLASPPSSSPALLSALCLILHN